jgi:hypothetical protein
VVASDELAVDGGVAGAGWTTTGAVEVSASVEIVEVAARLASSVLVALSGAEVAFVVDASDIVEMVEVAVVEDALLMLGVTTCGVAVAAVVVALSSDVKVELGTDC